jgi:hypothetical protein
MIAVALFEYLAFNENISLVIQALANLTEIHIPRKMLHAVRLHLNIVYYIKVISFIIDFRVNRIVFESNLKIQK